MKTYRTLVVAALMALAVVTFCSTAALAGEGWKDVAEFSYVMTGGNSETSALGFKNILSQKWDKSAFALKAGGVRVDTDTTVTTASDAGGPVVISEMTTSATTAENYFLNGRYDRTISERTFWLAGAGWDRNEFAGIKNRYIGEAGVGNIWRDTEDMKFSTTYSVTFTKQDEVSQDPLVDDSFLGVRLGWGYLNKLSANTTFTDDLVIDLNADETSDWRADMLAGLSVAMSEKLALKLGLQLLYDAEPSTFPLIATPGLTEIRVPFDDLDTIFTVSLVVNFR